MHASFLSALVQSCPKMISRPLLALCLAFGLVAGAAAQDLEPEIRVLGNGTNFVYVTVTDPEGQPLPDGPYVYTWSFISADPDAEPEGRATASTYIFPRNNSVEARSTRIVFIDDRAAENDEIRVTVSRQDGSGGDVEAEFRMPEGPDYNFNVQDLTRGAISPATATILRGTEMAYSFTGVIERELGGELVEEPYANVAVDWSITSTPESGSGIFFDDNAIVGNGRFAATIAGIDPATINATVIGTTTPILATTPVSILEPGLDLGPVITSGPWVDDSIVEISVDGQIASGSTGVHVRAQDNQQETNLRYSWSATGYRPYVGATLEADVIPTVTFSPNGSNEAKNSIATFVYPGVYELTATVFDPDGNFAERTVQVVVVHPDAPVNVARVVAEPPVQTVRTSEEAVFTMRFFDAAGRIIESGNDSITELDPVATITGPASVAVANDSNHLATVQAQTQAASNQALTYFTGIVHPTGPVTTAATLNVVVGTDAPLIHSLVAVESVLDLADVDEVGITATVTDDSPAGTWQNNWSVSAYRPYLGASVVQMPNNGMTFSASVVDPGDLTANPPELPTVETTATITYPGVYTVSYTVTDVDGNSDTRTVDVVVIESDSTRGIARLDIAPGQQTVRTGNQATYALRYFDAAGDRITEAAILESLDLHAESDPSVTFADEGDEFTVAHQNTPVQNQGIAIFTSIFHPWGELSASASLTVIPGQEVPVVGPLTASPVNPTAVTGEVALGEDGWNLSITVADDSEPQSWSEEWAIVDYRPYFGGSVQSIPDSANVTLSNQGQDPTSNDREGTIDSDLAGVFTVRYTVTDPDGNQASAERTVVFVDPNADTIVNMVNASQTVHRPTAAISVAVERVGSAAGRLMADYEIEYPNGDVIPGSVQWANGDAANKTILIPVGSVTSGSQEIRVTLTGTTSLMNDRLGGVTETVITVIAAESVVGFVDPQTTVMEGSALTTITIPVSRTGDPAQSAWVYYQIEDDTARLDKDYRAATGSPLAGRLNWSANDGAAKTIAVTIIGNDIPQPDRQFRVRLIASSDSVDLGRDEHIVRIIDDDGPHSGGRVGFAQQAMVANADEFGIVLRRTGNSVGTVKVEVAFQHRNQLINFNAVNDLALNGDINDFSWLEGSVQNGFTVTWNDSEMGDKVIPLTANRNTWDDHARIRMMVSALDGNPKLEFQQAALFIVSSQPAAPATSVSLPSSDITFTLTGGGDQVAVPVSFASAGADQRMAARFRTLNATAVAGVDYQSTAGWAIRMNNGDSYIVTEHVSESSEIVVPVLIGALADPRSFQVILYNPTNGGTIGSDDEVTVILEGEPGTTDRRLVLDGIHDHNYQWTVITPTGAQVDEQDGNRRQRLSGTTNRQRTRIVPVETMPASDF